MKNISLRYFFLLPLFSVTLKRKKKFDIIEIIESYHLHFTLTS